MNGAVKGGVRHGAKVKYSYVALKDARIILRKKGRHGVRKKS